MDPVDLTQLRIMRRREVLDLTGLSRATLYRWMGEKLFPSPLKLGPNSVGWRESEVREWIESRERASVPGTTGTSSDREPASTS